MEVGKGVEIDIFLLFMNFIWSCVEKLFLYIGISIILYFCGLIFSVYLFYL